MSSSNNPFGFDPEDFDRMVREAGEGLREAFGRVFEPGSQRGGWNVFFDQGRTTRARQEPETTGDAGDGVWAIYTVTDDGSATVEQVFATELDALRANKHNTDSKRKVRFLPYGIAVSALDDTVSDETS
ncbi:hypothetical protein BVC93_15970 [Mycobacterium sp. MS1601]|uniref:hypothetical protein n=1 Tax=Mycobacterium sp. MS1601 TaxID=1936029 RepID=UPI0009791DA4|nr:hypothetical protein [Mycobacterium sp. MS1601]AQA03668.1 hypothetical protein BVC93_15970 [Mycobacterium sp. MS1601]